ncbi:non-canonical purine NTP pyrophosphatase, partial [Bacteroidota bacterium]
PGPYIKHFIEKIGVEKFENLLEGKDKTTRVVCTIGYAVSEEEIHIIQGTVYGKITSADPSNKFQFDRIFIPDGYDKRFSEISIAEKNKTSHRGKALLKFKEFLEGH